MTEELNPESTLKPSEPSRKSVKSFWLACAGLAILAHVPAMGISHLLSQFEYLIIDAIFESQQFNQSFWLAREALTYLSSAALTPSIAIACVIPLLYWRGHLAQRFLISVVIAITVLNVVGNVEFYPRHMAAKWAELALIATCWISLPILFTCTPLKTRELRLIVASGVLLLCLCLSMLHMYEVQQNQFFLGWMALYGAAFTFALLRRNWGRVAMVEADKNAFDIQTTSTWTLFELIAVSGLACSAASFWSTDLDAKAAILLSSAAAFGLFMGMISIALIRFAFEPVSYRIPKLLALWISTAVLFCANGILLMLIDWSRYYATSLQFQAIMAVSSVYLIGSAVTSFAYLVLALTIGHWLRWCGWRVDRAPAKAASSVPSFNELN